MRRMAGTIDFSRFQNLTFGDFKKRAKDRSLSEWERIGFPDEYRKGYEKFILADVVSKLSGLRAAGKVIHDLGCGSSGLTRKIIRLSRINKSTLLLVDSKEMLSLLPNGPHMKKFPCRFPDCPHLVAEYHGKVDSILLYSVIQHVFLEDNVFDFIDGACELLAEGGELLIGDIPNISKRKRFFASEGGVRFHQTFTGKKERPSVAPFQMERKKIDDSIVLSIIQRYRNFGFDTYLLPQGPRLPMSNRREDILIRRP